MQIKKALVLMIALLCLGLSGCLLQSAEDLYALPKQSAEYYTLQSEIEQVLQSGAQFCAPVAGDRRQAVQLADLDSDGQEEAIAFFRTSGQKPLKIYIYKRTDTGYAQYAVIEGDGSAFESVAYQQIDTALGLEMVVGRQVSDQVPQALSIYSLGKDGVSELLSVNSIRHCLADLDGNGLQELLVFRTEEDSNVGLTEYYAWGEDGMALSGSTNMSAALTSDSIRRIVCGMMQKDTPAVFVANTYEEATIVTDVFIYGDDGFVNVSTLGTSANDSSRVRYRNVYGADIDNDGLIELPRIVRLPSVVGDEGTPYDKIRWYNLSPDGSRTYKQATFHNYTDGWYLTLLPEWEQALSVSYSHEPQELPAYWFCRTTGEKSERRFAVYAFSGANAQAQAQADGRFVLAEKGDVVYAGLLIDESITLEQLRAAFHLISMDWNSGEV